MNEVQLSKEHQVRRRLRKSDSDRKRAVFSCDRCKKRKIRCQRELSNQLTFDNAVPCLQCTSVDVVCKTTFPRKKRKYFSVSDTTRLQLRSLITLFGALYPTKDPNNPTDLQAIAKNLKVELPCSLEEAERDFKCSTKEEAAKNENDKAIRINLSEDEDWKNDDISSSDETAFKCEGEEEAQSYGLRGTSGLLKSVLKLKKSKNSAIFVSREGVQNLSSSTDKQSYNKVLHERFLIFDGISREDADAFVNSFFANVHPGYFILNERNVREKNKLFFDKFLESRTDQSEMSVESEHDIACIYMVWILGKKFNESLSRSTYNDFSTRCLKIVELLVGDSVTNPSLNGIRLIYLLAIYFDSVRKRDVAWQLLGLASQQCIGLGYTRESTIKNSPGDPQEKKTTWWSIFKLQMNMSASLGKTPSIEMGLVDIGPPKLSSEHDLLFSDYFSSSIDLFKIMFHILKHRKKLYVSNQPLASINVKRSVNLGHALEKWYGGLSPKLREYKKMTPVKRFQIKLHLQFRYLYVSLTLPYLLYLSRNWKSLKLSESGDLVDVLCDGIKATEGLCEVISYSDQTNQFNGLLHYDMFYAYNSIMVLILSFALLKSQNESYEAADNRQFLEKSLWREGFNLESILFSMKLIYRVNRRNNKFAKGLMKEASNNIDLLVIHFGLEEILKRDTVDCFSTSVEMVTGNSSSASIPLSPDNTSLKEKYLLLKSRYESESATTEDTGLTDIEFFNLEQNPLQDSFFLTFCDEVTSMGFIAEGKQDASHAHIRR